MEICTNAISLVKLCFLATQGTRSLPFTFTLFLPLILGITRVVLSWGFALFSIHFWIVCVIYFFPWSLETSERSSRQRSSVKNVLKRFTKLAGKYLCRSRPETLLRKSLRLRYFPVIFMKFFRTPFLQNISKLKLSFAII